MLALHVCLNGLNDPFTCSIHVSKKNIAPSQVSIFLTCFLSLALHVQRRAAAGAEQAIIMKPFNCDLKPEQGNG